MTSIRFVTFNIRCDYGADGENHFGNRGPLIIEKIRSEQPDIICFQEITPNVNEWLHEEFPEYMVCGMGRDADYGGERIVTLVRKERLELLGMRVFWLSPTPFVPGSRYEGQSIFPRICVATLLKPKNGVNPFWVYNTHLDHEVSAARNEEAKQLKQTIREDQQQGTFPALLAGDFNATPDSEEMYGFFHDTDLKDFTGRFDMTFHGFGVCSEKIDYIFGSEQIVCDRVEAWDECKDGIWLSDHYPLCADFSF